MVLMNMSRLVMSWAGEVFPALEQIPAMQRRRLSLVAKLALNSAMQILAEQRADYIVWVSQYGDETKTLKILEDVLHEQTPSPTQFSTSVHNAVSGLYSILCKDATPATSLAGSWNDALIEAYAWLKTTTEASRALVIYYDEALPELYAEHQPFTAFAMSAVVSLQPENLKLDLSQRSDEQAYFQQALQFYNFWQDDSQIESAAWTKC
ncbi:beta-ketoacyl synthase chain length factor [Acinetobacter sp. ANC 3813]|uniref:beta-ketoacyl synthase chain length factor n=1 Tax=Acinetobacter sp. ANC 3813 TaxID=1977873 RepID=UPI000A33E591|nr:beta-ketoacyl synthase chain length factor [Acinetobacter sp. ANC 3813]OTG89338.1 beta-ketoacyl synthase [Acinetobacter sp. ANC 3813]